MTITRIPRDDDFLEAATDPNDPAVKERRILESIAAKQAKAAARGPVDANGYRIIPKQQ